MVAAGVAVDPSAPPAGAAELTAFSGCDDLQAWYVDNTISQVGPYGWAGRRWMTMREDATTDSPQASESSGESASGSAKDEVANGSTGTNTQEAGVDEPDVAKTDGRVVVRLVNGQRLVITDVSGSAPQQIADWRLPSGSFVDGLLLVDDHVLLSGDHGDIALQGMEQGMDQGMELDRRVPGPWGGSGRTELLDVDVSDPAHPRLDSRTSWSGQQLSLRQYADTVRLVTSTGLPELPFVEPRPGSLTEQQAEHRNREILRDSTIEDWVPGLTDSHSSRPLVGCDEVYHPTRWSGSDTVAVATFTPGNVDDPSAVAVTGAGSEVYSSTDRLYVTSTDWAEQGPILMDDSQDSTMTSPDTSRPVMDTRTHIHAFALDGANTRYVASGSIDGTIRDRWSLDEYDGHLRVAVSWPDRMGSTRDNGIVVLDERGRSLEPVGELRGLGVDEQIESVRWFDDMAIVVTFRQMDPLYTIDLNNPAHPRELGALKIPGFSSYLHPIGHDRLLGMGTDATPDGRNLGAQAAVFDLSNPTRAQQVGKVTFGEESWLAASEDPHAFTWLPDADAAITSLSRMGHASGDGGTEMVVLRVSPSGELSTELLPSPGGYEQRALPLGDGRVALVGNEVRLVTLTAAGADH